MRNMLREARFKQFLVDLKSVKISPSDRTMKAKKLRYEINQNILAETANGKRIIKPRAVSNVNISKKRRACKK